MNAAKVATILACHFFVHKMHLFLVIALLF